MVDSRRVTVARARPLASRSRANPFDVSAADGEQRQRSDAAPAGELAQVQRVGVAGQPSVSGQVAGEGEPFGVGEGGLDGNEGSRGDSSGHRAPPGRAETRETGPAAGPSD
jgi:hypothetical protein